MFPALIAMIFIVAQAGLYYYARSVALAAAQEGARAGAAHNAVPAAARAEAEAFIDRVGRDLLRDRGVQVTRTPSRTSVTVTGLSPSLVPGYRGFEISQSAAAPLERVS